jgi:hypothetical protein
VRLIYVDEAGTSGSPHEPVAVVVGVLVDGDTQFKPVAQEIYSTFLKWVPKDLQGSYIFHATDVFSGRKHKDWPLETRIGLLKDMMSLPMRMYLPMVVGTVRKVSPVSPDITQGLSETEFFHMQAFAACLEAAGMYFRKFAASEAGVIVAEDLPKMPEKLKRVLQFIKRHPTRIQHDHQISEGIPEGWADPDPQLGVRQILDTVHFAQKPEALMLQLADACAFGIRRCASRQEFGMECLQSILGPMDMLDDYAQAIATAHVTSTPFAEALCGLEFKVTYSSDPVQ